MPKEFCIRSDVWRSHSDLRGCAPATRGIFADLICLAFEDGADGVVLIGGRSPSVSEIALRFGYAEHEVRSALYDLIYEMVLANVAFDGENISRIEIARNWVWLAGDA